MLVIFPSLYDAFAHEEDYCNISKTVLLISLSYYVQIYGKEAFAKKKIDVSNQMGKTGLVVKNREQP